MPTSETGIWTTDGLPVNAVAGRFVPPLRSDGSPIARRDRGFTLLELMVVMVIIGVVTSMALMVRGVPDVGELAKEEGKRLKVLISFSTEEAILTGREVGMQFYRGGYLFLQRENDEKWQYVSDGPMKERRFPPGFRAELTLDGRTVELPTGDERKPKPHLVFGTTGETASFRLELQGPKGYRMVLSGNGRGGMELKRSDRS
ncbi:MAG: type II secretion system minor pseudopilin GspH [Magnetococcales bacterium]|nr:type II secretion system minor pseudopilin GspH [Magnetococcales bacterium]MBF0321760.1 type II secretion system minor pseudopilin GspH [Magnetococcales bacterium]